ncbi:hypothetical protein KAU19_03970 [Candidatus Parcubacteria bacterium]|nr:hypothetical protein [Candidatus Parcubacteria bacterium]
MKEQFHARPPSGKRPDFEKLDNEGLSAVLKLECYDLEKYSDIIKDLEITVTEINKIKKGIGLPTNSIDVKKVRLIKKELFENSEYYKYTKRDGLYDEESGNIIFSFNDDKFFVDRSYNIDVRYNLIHEMVHKCMSGQGIHRDFFRLNEGITDAIAQEIMRNKILPDIISEQDESSRREFVKKNPFVLIDGDEANIELEDIAFVEEGKNPVSYRCIGERRLIKIIKQTKPEAYKLLLKAAFKGDNQAAKAVIVDNYGEQMLNDFKDTRTKFLLEKLDQEN